MNTWAEAMKAIGALEDRVKKLENSNPSPTHDGRIVVSANEYDALVRVRSKAVELVSHFSTFPDLGAIDLAHLVAMNARLRESHKR